MIISCTDNSSILDIDNPAVYDFSRDGMSTVSFTGQTDRIGMATELVSAMSDNSQSIETLLDMYSNESATGGDVDPFSDPTLNASTKSIKSKVAASKDFFSTNTVESSEIKEEIESWIEAQVSEVFPNYNNLASKGYPGQIADGSSARYVNGQGLEYNQAVSKSLIGALMVDQMLNNYLGESVLDEGDNENENTDKTTAEGKSYTTMEHKWDEAYGYLFGQSSDASNPLATLGEGAFLNKYLSRVNDDEDFNTIASDIFEAFKLGRAAIVANDYKLRNEQAAIIQEKISTVIAVRAIYYLQNGKKALANQDFGGAFHDLSEGFGFIYSLRFTRMPNSDKAYFSKSEVDGFISLLLEGNGFWDVSANTLDDISKDIAAKFDFTVAQAAE